jgi:hypothetical protein
MASAMSTTALANIIVTTAPTSRIGERELAMIGSAST